MSHRAATYLSSSGSPHSPDPIPPTSSTPQFHHRANRRPPCVAAPLAPILSTEAHPPLAHARARAQELEREPRSRSTRRPSILVAPRLHARRPLPVAALSSLCIARIRLGPCLPCSPAPPSSSRGRATDRRTARSPRLLWISLWPSLCSCLVTVFFPARTLSFLPASELPCAAGSETPSPGPARSRRSRRRQSPSPESLVGSRADLQVPRCATLLPVEKTRMAPPLSRGRRAPRPHPLTASLPCFARTGRPRLP